MKRLVSAAVLAVALVLATASPALAEEKMLGVVTSIALQDGGAVATLKDARSGQLVEITVSDAITLEKFKDKRIGVGDEIKAKYEKVDGRNQATFFKKAGGC